jgi:hypothetical protein
MSSRNKLGRWLLDAAVTEQRQLTLEQCKARSCLQDLHQRPSVWMRKKVVTALRKRESFIVVFGLFFVIDDFAVLRSRLSVVWRW